VRVTIRGIEPLPEMGEKLIVPPPSTLLFESNAAVHEILLAATTWNVPVRVPPEQPPADPMVTFVGITALTISVQVG